MDKEALESTMKHHDLYYYEEKCRLEDELAAMKNININMQTEQKVIFEYR